jgi:hypothetical protein
LFSVFISFFSAMCFWLLFSVGLRLISGSTGPEADKKPVPIGSHGERAFHSPLLLIVVGMMSFFIFPIFLMLIETVSAKEGFTSSDMFYILIFLATALMSFFYFVREHGVRR